MKKLLSILLVLCMSVSLFTGVSFATNIVNSGVCGIDLSWILDDAGTLAISGFGAMADNVSWPFSISSVKKIVIEPGATSIGERAFSNFGSLSSVSIASTVLTIGESAFYGCNSLSTITLPDSVTYIGTSAFDKCTALSSIVIPASVSTIEPGYDVNYYNSNVPTLYSCFFGGCSSLTKIMVDPNNAVYSSLDGNLYNKEQTVCLRYTPGKAEVSFVVPDSVTGIYDSAFCKCAALKTVTLPDGLLSIGTAAFNGCTNLVSVNIPEKVTTISKVSFQNCALTQVKLPESVRRVENYAFSECVNLATLIVPYTVTYVSSLAFEGCTNGQTVYYTGTEKQWLDIKESFVNPTVKYVDPSGLCGTGLTWMLNRSKSKLIISGSGAMPNYSEDTPAPWYPFWADVKEISVQNGVTSIGDYAFFNCASSSITIPNSVTTIGKHAFQNSGLTSIVVPDNVTEIGEYAFMNCSSLTSVDLGASLDKIEPFLFSTCSNLNSVSIPNSVTTIGEKAFYDCSVLNQIVLPKSLTEIGSYAFYKCAVTDISLPGKVTTIGNHAFYYSNVKSVFIPKSVSSIGKYAFENSVLTDVSYSGTNFDWANIAIDTNNSKLLNATFHYIEQVAEPNSSVASGEVESGTEVTLTAEDGVTIYYSVDGSDPTTVYTTPIVIAEDTTLKAFAIKEGLLDSDVVTYTYTVKQAEETPDDPVIPTNAPTLAFGNVKAKSGGTVVVPLTISNNPGIAGLSIRIRYDSALTLTELAVGDALSGLDFTNPKTLTANPLKLLWDGVDNDCSNGDILYLTFTVAEGAEEGGYNISATYDAGDIYNGDMDDVEFAIVEGKVTVKNSTPGDVNDDGIVNGKDVTLIRRHVLTGYDQTINEDAADVNNDGIINGKDVTLVRRAIIGGYDVELK